jgi:pimeloyl-ACP methyl ester carboxylesterase
MRPLTPWSLRVQLPLGVRHHNHRQLLPTCTAVPRRYFTHDADVAERYHRTVILPDGRQLTWAEAGSPTGFPCFMFHGFPGSRLEARGLEDIGKRHSVRFICPDRPGYGLSNFQPNRRILDWPGDVQYMARHLDLKRYAVLGGSGGGPYALACAYAIPPDTLSAAGLLCSAAPWEAGTQDILWSARIGSWAATYFPSLSTGFINLLIGAAKWLVATDNGKKMIDEITVKAIATAGREIPESEKTPEAVAVRRERLLRIFFEPFEQGSKGFVQEAYLLTHPYGFRLEDVNFENKVQIWHGTKDVNSPIRMVRYMRDRLPHCDLHEFEGDTHFTIMKRLEEIVVKLTAQR